MTEIWINHQAFWGLTGLLLFSFGLIKADYRIIRGRIHFPNMGPLGWLGALILTASIIF